MRNFTSWINTWKKTFKINVGEKWIQDFVKIVHLIIKEKVEDK